MNIVSGSAGSLPAGVFHRTGAYRHRVFIEQLKWELPVTGGIEQDQFDRPDTLYVVAQDEEGEVCGCARLLPTTVPYLLGEVFPQLMNGAAPPRSPDVWELSRFAAVDFSDASASPLRQFSARTAVALLRAAIACARERGAKRLITVSPLGIERLLRREGFNAHRAGPPLNVDGHLIFACWIEVEPEQVSIS